MIQPGVTPAARHQLLRFLLADDASAAEAAAWFAERNGWLEALALAKSWKAIPTLNDRVRALRVPLNATEAAALRKEFLIAYTRSARCASHAAAALAGLEAGGIRVAAFKGIASIVRLYGDARHRTIHDADILLGRRDLARALACLERHGFRRRGAETLEQYLRFVENAPGFAGNQAITVYDDREAEIDLHWELAGSGMPVEEILSRATACELAGVRIGVVDAVDGFLLALHHAVRENLAIENICRDLLDIERWLEHLRAAGRLEEGLERTANSRGKVPALMVTELLAGYDPAGAVAEAAARLREGATGAEQRSAAGLAELFRYQLEHGELGKDVFYLVHSRPWRQIVHGLTRDWLGYRRSMRTMEENLGADQPLGSRFAQLARSVPGWRALRLARHLAAIKYGVN